MADISAKYEKLKGIIADYESLAVAFSGGVDSTFLLKTAADVLGDKVAAVTARSCSFPKRELDAAADFCSRENIRHIICDSEELEIEGFSKNPKNRCYLCKSELFGKIWDIARENELKNVAEGSNTDDEGDYRPGLLAVKELGVKSPLREAALNKEEIRQLSKEMSLPTWNKPSFACLSSRFPYGETITPEKLAMIDEAEQLLLDLGFRQVRVRHHGDVARIEIEDGDFEKMLSADIRNIIYRSLKKIGFTYVALDIAGYRTGSMNETLI